MIEKMEKVYIYSLRGQSTDIMEDIQRCGVVEPTATQSMLEEDAVKILERSESIDLSREEDLVDKLDECIAALKEFGEKRSLFYKRPLVTYKELTNDQVLFDTMKTCDHIEGIVKERNRYQKELTKAEYMRLLKTAENRRNERLFLLLQTICATGIRVGELKFVTAEAIEQGKAAVDNKGKNRIVFLPGKLCKALKKYRKKRGITTGSIFVTRTGKPLDRSNIWKEMKGLCEEAGVSVKKVFPHNLRHLFARCYYAMHRDIARLADILGHSSIDTTRIYMVSTGSEHRSQIEQLKLACMNP